MRLSMRDASHGSDSRGARETPDHDLDGLSRLDFGVRLGAGAALLLGSGPQHALAEEDAAVVDTDGGTVAAEAAAMPAAAPGAISLRDLGFEVPYTGKSFPLSKFLGSKATLVVNPKIDDPESLHQVRVFCVCVTAAAFVGGI